MLLLKLFNIESCQSCSERIIHLLLLYVLISLQLFLLYFHLNLLEIILSVKLSIISVSIQVLHLLLYYLLIVSSHLCINLKLCNSSRHFLSIHNSISHLHHIVHFDNHVLEHFLTIQFTNELLVLGQLQIKSSLFCHQLLKITNFL